MLFAISIDNNLKGHLGTRYDVRQLIESGGGGVIDQFEDYCETVSEAHACLINWVVG